ncbi:hypothetical protein IAU60_006860 [Kwoniella sp. DSM 27419]
MRQNNNERHVFAHFMVGFVGGYTQDDWIRDVQLAQSYGIDGFALNCDRQDSIAVQLKYAFTAAAATDFKLFISPDFVHYDPDDSGPVSDLLRPWLSEPAYFRYDNRPFVSSFWGEGTDWIRVSESVGSRLYIVPYYYASQTAVDTPGLDGLFSWYAWPGQDSPDVVDQNMTTAKDLEYLDLLAAAGKTYMAPVSPWFYSHLPASTGYPKNFFLNSDTLWPTRWQQILDLAISHPDQLKFVEIITWNDWTESSLITSFRGGDQNDGNTKWAADFDHTSLMDMMVPFIKAFKSGMPTPQVEESKLVWWYRPTLKDAQCDATDSVGSKPIGWEMAADLIFVAALTTGPASVTVKSGSVTSTQQVDSAGVHTLAFPMTAGPVTLSMEVDSGTAISGKGAIDIFDQCYQGVYNFNVLAGSA